jgi:hypothetical protein
VEEKQKHRKHEKTEGKATSEGGQEGAKCKADDSIDVKNGDSNLNNPYVIQTLRIGLI